MENIYSKYLEGKTVPDNIEVDNNPYSKYLPYEEKHKFKITTEGNRGSNLTNEDMTEPGEKSYDLNPYAKYLKLKEPVEFELSILDDEEQKFWDHMEEKNDRSR
jgi:hypothetical protein